MSRDIAVFGPAYLDRVLRVDDALIPPGFGPPLDQSVDGRLGFSETPGLEIRDPSGFEIHVRCPAGWPGPEGRIEVNRVLRAGVSGRRTVRGVAWQDDLGGMGAGYAAALGGSLASALGPESDPNSRAIARLLEAAGIAHRAIGIADQPADWTLLITSGNHGDKLPIGFRGCHAAIRPDQLDPLIEGIGQTLVVAALPNRLAAQVLSAPNARLRFFAPAMRNMLDIECPISSFAGNIDLLCCNRQEWESMEDREEVAWKVSILVVTDGPNGGTIRFTAPNGDPGRISVPAFPRARPPRDTNRAGEAFASTLLATLLDHRWPPEQGVIEADLIRLAALRGSAAAGLVLDRVDFGFPPPAEIDRAVAIGRID